MKRWTPRHTMLRMGWAGLLLLGACTPEPAREAPDVPAPARASVRRLEVLHCPSPDAELASCTPLPDPIHQPDALSLRLVTHLEDRVSTPCAIEWTALHGEEPLGTLTQRVEDTLQTDALLTLPLEGLPPRFTLTLTAGSPPPLGDTLACSLDYSVKTTFILDVRTCVEGLADPAGDGLDANCDGVDGEDDDGDGVASAASGGLDCSDAEGFGDACRLPDDGIEPALLGAPASRLTAATLPAKLTRQEHEAIPGPPLNLDLTLENGDVLLDFNYLVNLFFEQLFDVSDGDYLNARIREGSFAVGMSWLTTPEGGFDLALYEVADAPDDTGASIHGANLLDDTGRLQSALLGIEVDAEGRWESHLPGRVTLAFPFGGVRLPVQLHRVYGAGQVTLHEDGATTWVTLYGAVVAEELYTSLNAYANAACPCLELNGDALFPQSERSTEELEQLCRAPEDAGCRQLAASWWFITALLEGASTLDLDSDRTPEGIPAVVRLEGTPARFSDIATP